MNVITRGIPIPPHGNVGKGRPQFHRRKYHFENLAVGDSFLVKLKNPLAGLEAFSYIYRQAKRNGMEVTSRKESNGFRFWRIV